MKSKFLYALTVLSVLLLAVVITDAQIISSGASAAVTPWVIIQQVDCSGNTGFSCTLSPTASGSAGYLTFGSWDNAAITVTSVSGACSGTWTATGAADSGSSILFSDIWYCERLTPGSTLIQPNYSGGGAGHFYAHFWEVSGMLASSSLDVKSGDHSVGSFTTAPVTTTSTGDFIVAVMTPIGTPTGIAGGNEFTSDTTNSGNVGSAHLTSNSGTAGSHQAIFTATGGAGYVSSIAAFKTH